MALVGPGDNGPVGGDRCRGAIIAAMQRPPRKRSVWAWALYDWANSAYATTVMAGFFPVFFKEYWSAGVPAGESSFHLGLANSFASLVIVLLAPLLGAIADRGRSRKRFLAVGAGIGIAATGGLYFLGQGAWPAAAALYAVATIGFSASLIFYDSLIVSVTHGGRFDTVSALGFALGYLGGGVLLAVNVLMTVHPQWFGLADVTEAVRFSFVTVALWWLVFSIPLFRWVEEPPGTGVVRGLSVVRAGWRQLVGTFREIRRVRMAFIFLLAYWCYIDGVDTVVRMAVDYGLALGFGSRDLLMALLLTQFVGFPSAVVFGRLGERYGPKRGIYIGLGVYVGVVVWASRMDSVAEFYALAVAVGLVQGGVQALSRSLYARLVPPDKSGEFFGFFNMLGKFAAVVGPVMVGWTSAATGDPRLSLLTLLLLFGLGALVLTRVRVPEGAGVGYQDSSGV